MRSASRCAASCAAVCSAWMASWRRCSSVAWAWVSAMFGRVTAGRSAGGVGGAGGGAGAGAGGAAAGAASCAAGSGNVIVAGLFVSLRLAARIGVAVSSGAGAGAAVSCAAGAAAGFGWAGASETRRSFAAKRRSSQGKCRPGRPKASPPSVRLNSNACASREIAIARCRRLGPGGVKTAVLKCGDPLLKRAHLSSSAASSADMTAHSAAIDAWTA